MWKSSTYSNARSSVTIIYSNKIAGHSYGIDNNVIETF